MEAKETPAIVFENVTKRFGKFNALDAISFEVGEGSITGFVGPNGAGKTTSIRLMSGLLIADGGTVTVNGENPYSSIRMREKVFFIMDTINIPPHLQIYDYLLHLSRIYDFPPSAIKNAFISLDIWSARERKIGQLSAGMKQKAQLAVALCAKAETVIADEPASNMDPGARMQLYDTIRRLNRENGTTFFISSHILTELEKVIDSVIIISRGRKLAQSSISDVIANASLKYGDGAVSVRVSDVSAASRAVKVIAIDGDTIIVKPDDGRLGPLITRLETAGITVSSVEKQRPDLGDVFSEVVSGEQVT